jgi:glutaredoxin
VINGWARVGRAALVVAVWLSAGEAAGCRHGRTSVTSAPQHAPTVRDDSEGYLLTWIDDKGEFHVETRVTDVPMMGRDAVRVVDPSQDDGSHADSIFVVDLRQLHADGTYAVRTMSRPDFDAIAVSRREKTGPTLANPDPTPSSAAAAAGPEPSAAGAVSSRGVVVIYGAEWCGACHEAARYLRRKGIAYVEKDVEKDPSAEREMQQKLARKGLQAGSIPVLDVRGKVLVGFSPAEVDAALGEAL